jgi:predicted glycosyltransferase involved in capsule biosynthesis
MISIIIPYQKNPGRQKLIDCTRERIINLWNINVKQGQGLSHIEIVISKQEDNNIFHRAWVLNKGARKSEGDLLIFMDGDLILPDDYFSMIENNICCKTNTSKYNCPIVGWRRLHMVGSEVTKLYLKRKIGMDKLMSVSNIRNPNIDGNAGGITIIPRDIFFEFKGFPEDFKGSWGGEDNTFWHKMEAFGYEFKSIDADICHLYHEHKTPRKSDIHEKRHQMGGWTKERWQERLKEIGDNWGR